MISSGVAVRTEGNGRWREAEGGEYEGEEGVEGDQPRIG